MLYFLSQYLDRLDIPGAGMWTYVSFRSLLALMLSLTISMVAGKRFITYMKRKRHFESARDAEIDPYGVQKNGTPSMGGVIIVGAVVIPDLLRQLPHLSHSGIIFRFSVGGPSLSAGHPVHELKEIPHTGGRSAFLPAAG